MLRFTSYWSSRWQACHVGPEAELKPTPVAQSRRQARFSYFNNPRPGFVVLKVAVADGLHHNYFAYTKRKINAKQGCF